MNLLINTYFFTQHIVAGGGFCHTFFTLLRLSLIS